MSQVCGCIAEGTASDVPTARMEKALTKMLGNTNGINRWKPTHPRKKSSPDSRKSGDRFKEGLSVAKDLIDVVLKISPLALIAPALTLWIYLRRIGWDEILGESIGSVSGLVTLLASAVLSLMLFALLFCIPSFFIFLFADFFKDVQAKRGRGIKLIVWLHYLSGLIWQIAFVLSLIVDRHATLPPIIVATVVCGLFALSFCGWFRAELMTRKSRLDHHESSFHKRVAAHLTDGFQYGFTLVRLCITPILASFATALPLQALIWATGLAKLTSTEANVVFVFCSFASLTGMLPGVVYLIARFAGVTTGKTLMAGGITLMCVSYLVLMVAFYFAPVASTILGVAGLYDVRPHVYQLLNDRLVPSVRAAHLPIYEGQRANRGDAPAFFIGAYVRYNFGGVKLLCLHAYDPDSITGSEIEIARQKGKPDPRLAAGDGCMPFKADDLKPVRRSVG